MLGFYPTASMATAEGPQGVTASTATASISEAAETSSATATVPATVSSSITEASETVAGLSTAPESAGANISEAADSVSATANDPEVASANLTEAAETVTGVATSSGAANATASITEASEGVVGTATVTGGGPSTGTASINEAADSAAGNVIISVNPLQLVDTYTHIDGYITPTTKTLLTSGNTFVYVKGRQQHLWMYNTSVSTVTVTITGDAASPVIVAGTAGAQFSFSSGISIVIPAGQFSLLPLEKACGYLRGNLSIVASITSIVDACIITSG